MLADVQTRNCLGKRCIGIKIRIGDAPVARPKAGVDGELGQVGEPTSGLVRAVRLTAWQHLERGEVERLRAFRFQVVLKKPGVTDLVVGIVVDVLRHVPIEELQRLHIGGIPASESAEFVILGTPEFRVLPPKVFFDLLKGLQES